MKNKEDYDIEEYRYIHDEIITHQRLTFQIFTFSVIASVSILGYGLSNDYSTANPLELLIFVCPIVIILPCAWIISNIREQIFRWGAYIQVSHEQSKTAYETKLSILKKRNTKSFKESYTPIICTLWGMMIISIALYFIHIVLMSSDSLDSNCNIITTTGIIIGLVSIILLYLISKRYKHITKDKYHQELLQQWQNTMEE